MTNQLTTIRSLQEIASSFDCDALIGAFFLYLGTAPEGASEGIHGVQNLSWPYMRFLGTPCHLNTSQM